MAEHLSWIPGGSRLEYSWSLHQQSGRCSPVCLVSHHLLAGSLAQSGLCVDLV